MILDFLFANKYLMAALGAVLAAAFLYFKGKNAGVAQEKAFQDYLAQKFQESLRGVEAKNQEIEAKRNEDVKDIKSIDDLTVLDRLFNELNKKADGSDADKKPE